jgi:hypothetical protein
VVLVVTCLTSTTVQRPSGFQFADGGGVDSRDSAVRLDGVDRACEPDVFKGGQRDYRQFASWLQKLCAATGPDLAVTATGKEE